MASSYHVTCVLISTATSCLHRLRVAQDICIQCWSSLTHLREEGRMQAHPFFPEKKEQS